MEAIMPYRNSTTMATAIKRLVEIRCIQAPCAASLRLRAQVGQGVAFFQGPGWNGAAAAGNQGADAVSEVAGSGRGPSLTEAVQKCRGKGVTGTNGISHLDAVARRFD